MPAKKKKEEVVDVVVYEKKPKSKSTKKEEKVIEPENIGAKPYFFPRLIAYIIDIILVSMVCTGLMFLIPENKNYDKYMNEFEQVQVEAMEGKMELEEYFNKYANIVYDIDYSNVLPIIIEVTLIILYFIVFQFYNRGQTLGKKFMKLRVISINDEKLTINQIAYRALIINSILVNILILGSLLFLGRDYYFYASFVLQIVASIIVVTTLIMILFSKEGRGLHDVISATKVIQEN